MIYYSGVQILRGISVLAVVLYHLFPNMVTIGYVGVDIFLVISGFVVSLSLINNNQAINFSFIFGFYKKRFLRLFPPLFVCCLFYLLIFFYIFPSVKFLETLSHSFYSVLGLSNFFYYRLGDYFSNDSSVMPFLHTWSLSLEWQFYIILPFMFLLRKHHNLVILILFLVSFILFIQIFDQSTRFSYFMLPTRLWEFLIGVILGINAPRWDKVKFIPFNFLLILLAGWLVLGSIFLTLEKSQVIMVSVLLASLSLVRLVHGDSDRIFPLKILGNASYSIYLYHWPLIGSLNYLYIEDPIVRTALCFVSVLFGGLSYFIVEKKRYHIITASVLIFAAITFHFSLVAKPSSFRTNLDIQANNKLFKNGTCSVAWNNRFVDPKRCSFNGSSEIMSAKILVVGDSFAEAFANGMLYGNKDIPGLGIFARGCFPVLDVERRGQAGEFNCINFYEDVLQLASDLESLSTIIVVSRFDHYLNETHFLENPSFTEHGIAPVKYIKANGDVVSTSYLLDGFEDFLLELKQQNANAQIVVLHGFPYGTRDAIRVGFNKVLFRDFSDEISVRITQHKMRNAKFERVLEGLDSIGVTAIDASRVACSAENCWMFRDGLPYYFDDDHPSIFLVAKIIDYYGLRKLFMPNDE